MFTLDYTSIKKFLLSFSLSDHDILWNDDVYLQYYDFCLRFRHDLIHYILSLSIFGKWVEEKRIIDVFPDYVGPNSYQTPDIIYEYQNVIYIIDVSVTTLYWKTKAEKIEKYVAISETLKVMLGKEVNIIPFIYNFRQDNFNQQLQEIKQLLNYPIQGNYLTEGLSLYEQKIKVCENCDKKILDNHKKTKYGGQPEIQGKIKNTKIDPLILNDIFNKKYEKNNQIIGTEEEFIGFLKKYMVSDISNLYKDEINDYKKFENISQQIETGNKEFEIKIKPTLFVLYPNYEPQFQHQYENKSEQLMTKNLITYILENKVEDGDMKYNFLINLFDQTNLILNDKSNKNKFMFGEYLNNEKEKKEEFKNLKESNRVNKFQSYHQYLIDSNLIEDTTEIGYASSSKTIRYKMSMFEKNTKDYILKSGNMFYKSNKYKESRPSTKTTTPLEEAYKIDRFINHLIKIEPSYWDRSLEEIFNFCINEEFEIPDSPTTKQMKKEHINEYKFELSRVLSLNSTKLLWFNHLVSSQFMHYFSLTNKQEEMTFINCGAPNCLIIICGGYRSNDNDNAKAFMSLVVTKNPEYYDEIYGDISKIKLKDNNWLIITNWRRLSLDKCTHTRDSFYSILSTTMSFYFDQLETENVYKDKLHSLKTLISLCPIQQISEFLMDNRYAYMSSFSSYTNITKLILQKFKPPYQNLLSVWIIKRLLDRLPVITRITLSGEGIKYNQPTYTHDKRDVSSLGGDIKIPSLWFNYNCNNIHQIVEEIFIYVLTPKEPSNTYHEKINAVNTILEYQQKYENTPENIKYGNIKNEEDYWFFAKTQLSNEIGFSSTVIHHSIKNLLRIIKPDYETIIDKVLSEDLSEIVSTKSVIHSLNREISEDDSKVIKKSILKRFYKKLLKSGNEVDEEKLEEVVKIYIKKNDSEIYKTKDRQKVWETIIQIMEKENEISTVEDLANYFLKNQNGCVEADICIKAQYGSKREFYVVNIGAKAAARIVEKFYQYMCEICPTECISVGGDKKMLVMQKNLDEAIKYCTENNLTMKYVNGDCTKWSAAETMGSFLAMTNAIDEIPVEFNLLLKTIFSCWADKYINIPPEIVIKSLPLMEKTKDLLNIENNKAQIHSTHNFLQGMFNYSSSFKASSCAYYTSRIWNILYPESKLQVYHNEHSDDYVQIIVYENENEFIDYRKLFKLMMKFHGYNDSERKTSCQQLFMEFVSLISFNGQMIYPKIKKTKEINLSLPCTGYRQDIDSALSRQGECQRMGANLSFCYLFQKLHMYCVREAYSLNKNMRNDLKINPYTYPVEMYGCPDQLPIFTLFCSGTINNYRLYKYGDNEARKRISGLINLSFINKDYDISMLNPSSYENMIYNPKFIYETNITILRKLKKYFNIDINEVDEYWKQNITDKIVKPKERERLIKWMKYKFLDRIFLEAYTKMSRTKMTLRLSRYVSKRTIVWKYTDEIFSEDSKYKIDLMDINESFHRMMSYCDSNKKIYDLQELARVLTKSDPTCQLIYSYLETTTFKKLDSDFAKKTYTVGTYLPSKLSYVYVENEPGVLLQYCLNKENFEKDKRKVRYLMSLEKDKEILEKNYGDLSKLDQYNILTIYNDLSISRYKPPLYMGYTRAKTPLIEALNEQFTHNFFKKSMWICNQKEILNVKSPITGGIFYHTVKGLTQTTNQQCLETICLVYSFLTLKTNFKINEIIKIIRELNIRYEEDDCIKESTVEIILDSYNLNYFKLHPNSVNEMKISGFFKYLLQGDTGILKKLVKSVYGYSREYVERAIWTPNGYIGTTSCYFKYMNRSFFMKQENNNIPTMYTNEKNCEINKMAYLVCLRLGNMINESDFQKMLLGYDLGFYESDLIKLNVSSKFKNRAVTVNENNSLKLYYKNYPKRVIPIILTHNQIRNVVGGDKEIIGMVPRIHPRKMIVNIGDTKLFTLPFWECYQYPIITTSYQYEIDSIPLTEWLKNKLIYRFMHGKQIHSTEIKHVDEQSLKNTILKSHRTLVNENVKKRIGKIIDNDDFLDEIKIEKRIGKESFFKEKENKEETKEQQIPIPRFEIDTTDIEIDFNDNIYNDDDELEVLDLGGDFMNNFEYKIEKDQEEIQTINSNLLDYDEPLVNYDDILDFGILDDQHEVISEIQQVESKAQEMVSVGFNIKLGSVENWKKTITKITKKNHYIQTLIERKPLIIDYLYNHYNYKKKKIITAEEYYYAMKTIDTYYCSELEEKIRMLYVFYFFVYNYDMVIKVENYSPKKFYITNLEEPIIKEFVVIHNTVEAKEKFKKNDKIYETTDYFLLSKKAKKTTINIEIILENVTFCGSTMIEFLKRPSKIKQEVSPDEFD